MAGPEVATDREAPSSISSLPVTRTGNVSRFGRLVGKRAHEVLVNVPDAKFGQCSRPDAHHSSSERA